jgi:hypothetical protein
MSSELLHVPQTAPTSDTRARVMKVRRPECDEHPASLSDV